MSASKKPRADAVLKTLPEDRQLAIIEHLREHKQLETKQWLHADGITTSAAALSEFWSWWHLRQEWREDETTTDSVLEQLKREVPDISEEQLDEFGQRTFSLLAIRRRNPDAFVKVRSARHKARMDVEKLKLAQKAEERRGEELELQRTKYQRETAELFLKWFKDRTATEIAENTSLTQPQKIEAIGKQMFGDLWE